MPVTGIDAYYSIHQHKTIQKRSTYDKVIINMHQVIIQNGKLFSINVVEDKCSCYKAVKPCDGTYMVRDKEYTLFSEREGFIFRCTTSGFSDNSDLNHGINGYQQTVGDAISSIVNGPDSIYGEFKVFYNDVEIPRGKGYPGKIEQNIQELNLTLLHQ